MKEEISLSISPSMDPRDAASTFAQGILLTANSEIVASADAGAGAELLAIRNKNDGSVKATLVAHRIADSGNLKLSFIGEDEGIPHERPVALAILAKLTPTEDMKSLLWRENARWQLAKAGLLEPKPLPAEKPAQAPKKPDAKQDQREIRRREIPKMQNDNAFPAEKRREEEPVAKKFRCLVDRLPRVLEAKSTKTKFIKFTGYFMGPGGEHGFIKAILFGDSAETAQRMIEETIGETGTCSVKLDGRMRNKGDAREIYIEKVEDVRATEERIPVARAKDSGDDERRRRSDAGRDARE